MASPPSISSSAPCHGRGVYSSLVRPFSQKPPLSWPVVHSTSIFPPSTSGYSGSTGALPFSSPRPNQGSSTTGAGTEVLTTGLDTRLRQRQRQPEPQYPPPPPPRFLEKRPMRQLLWRPRRLGAREPLTEVQTAGFFVDRRPPPPPELQPSPPHGPCASSSDAPRGTSVVVCDVGKPETESYTSKVAEMGEGRVLLSPREHCNIFDEFGSSDDEYPCNEAYCSESDSNVDVSAPPVSPPPCYVDAEDVACCEEGWVLMADCTACADNPYHECSPCCVKPTAAAPEREASPRTVRRTLSLRSPAGRNLRDVSSKKVPVASDEHVCLEGEEAGKKSGAGREMRRKNKTLPCPPANVDLSACSRSSRRLQAAFGSAVVELQIIESKFKKKDIGIVSIEPLIRDAIQELQVGRAKYEQLLDDIGAFLKNC